MQVTNIFFPKNKFKAAQPQDPCRLCSYRTYDYDEIHMSAHKEA